MNNILHSVYLKYDTGIQSLTRRALAQVCLKTIYNESSRGSSLNHIKQRIFEYAGIEVRNSDLKEALDYLENKVGQIHQTRGKYFITQKALDEINLIVTKSKNEQQAVIKYWFSETQTIKKENNSETIEKWFQYVLIGYFKNYKYDWLIELKQGKLNGKKQTSRIDEIIDNSFVEFSEIIHEDHEWLKKQIIGFLESSRPDDQLIHWTYGASAFSSALITANNYADQFSLESFKDSTLILDTNVLMILGLEGFEHVRAIEKIESVFDKLNIKLIYFDISKSEYRNALFARKNSILASLDKFGIEVLKNAECPYVKTAILRQVGNRQDFEVFFEQVEDIQNFFSEKVPIELEDYSEIDDVIQVSRLDESIHHKINKIYKNRTGRNKRLNALNHDAGLLGGAEYIRNKNKKTWILTRDSTLKTFSFENCLRNELPIVVGLDSLIQLMAADAGGADIEASDFAPIFSKIVKADLILDREIYSPDDLYILLESRIEIDKLGENKVMEIAKGVNKIRFSGADEKEIAFMIRKSFNNSVDDIKRNADKFSEEAFQYKNKFLEKDKETKRLRELSVNAIYDSKILKLKLKVRNNWIILICISIALGASAFGIYKLAIKNNPGISTLVSAILTLVLDFGLARLLKLKLYITANDKNKTRKEAELEIFDKEHKN